MSIEDTEANLFRRSQFVAQHDTTEVETALRAGWEAENERRRTLESLDTEWANSGLAECVADVADKLGYTYVMSKLISPHQFGYEDLRVNLPLRLGSRTREVFYVGDEASVVTASRGALVMYRTVEGNDRVKEAGFYTLLTQLKDQPTPVLTFGPLDTADDTHWQMVKLETVLSGENNGGGFAQDDVARCDRRGLEPFATQAAIDSVVRLSKVAAESDGKPWQEHFINMGRSEPSYRDFIYELMDDGFAKDVDNRWLRRDKVTVGMLRQNETVYVEGESARMAVNVALQGFFDDVTDPMTTRPDHRQAALADLEHGIAIERLDQGQVSEIDVAHSIIRRAARDKAKPASGVTVRAFASATIDRLRGIDVSVTYDVYPETKAILDDIYRDRSEPGDIVDGIDWGRSLRWMHRSSAAKGEWSTLFGGGREAHEAIKQFANLKDIKPSPLAFPYD